jgi:hypothetical protein
MDNVAVDKNMPMTEKFIKIFSHALTANGCICKLL